MLPPEKPLDFIVLIPYYNDLSGLKAALSSIHYDPWKYGIVVVDDGSKLPLQLSQIKSFCHSEYVHLKTLQFNQGIIGALNTGLDFIYNNLLTKYIARLDCGDTCMPQRFLQQVNYLDAHPDKDMLGSWCYFTDHENNKQFLYRTPVNDRKIRLGMYFRNLFIHPTMMWRYESKDIIRQYPKKYPNAEDYALAYAILKKGRASILPEALMNCRINMAGLSFGRREEQLRSRSLVVSDYGENAFLKRLGVLKLKLMMYMPTGWTLAYKFIFRRMQQKIQN